MTQLRQKKYYDQRLYQTRFGYGDLVYKIDDTTKVGHSKKLRPVWIGPYIVKRVKSPVLYEVIGRRGKVFVLHHDKLKLCEDRAIPLWVRRKRHRMLNMTRNADDVTLTDSQDSQLVTSLNSTRVQTQVKTLTSKNKLLSNF